jgi:hypothetical protein
MKYSLFFIVLISTLILACKSDVTNGVLVNFDVLYKVEGTSNSITVQYKTENGDTVTLSGVTPIWTHQWTRKGIHNDTVYIYAEATGTGTVLRTLKIGIYLDGNVLDTNSISGSGLLITSITMTIP